MLRKIYNQLNRLLRLQKKIDTALNDLNQDNKNETLQLQVITLTDQAKQITDSLDDVFKKYEKTESSAIALLLNGIAVGMQELSLYSGNTLDLIHAVAKNSDEKHGGDSVWILIRYLSGDQSVIYDPYSSNLKDGIFTFFVRDGEGTEVEDAGGQQTGGAGPCALDEMAQGSYSAGRDHGYPHRGAGGT